jgi:hypothetical protein
MDPHERAMRFLEEANELAQAMGVNGTEAIRVARHVYGKVPGMIHQELGGAGMTLLACAESNEELLSGCIYQELERVESLPLERFRDRQAENAKNGIGAEPD